MIEEQAVAGTITVINLIVNIDPYMCYEFGRECIEDNLCKITECIFRTNGDILINWIW